MIQASFDVVALYPSIPVEKALSCARERLMKDRRFLREQTGMYMTVYNYCKSVLKLISKQLIAESTHKLMELQSESQ